MMASGRGPQPYAVHRLCRQVMSHNKERRSKRDEKLDKKSQAMEELKAEREKKKNKTGWCVLRPSVTGFTLKS